jgi:hypothetical protein
VLGGKEVEPIPVGDADVPVHCYSEARIRVSWACDSEPEQRSFFLTFNLALMVSRTIRGDFVQTS